MYSFPFYLDKMPGNVLAKTGVTATVTALGLWQTKGAVGQTTSHGAGGSGGATRQTNNNGWSLQGHKASYSWEGDAHKETMQQMQMWK